MSQQLAGDGMLACQVEKGGGQRLVLRVSIHFFQQVVFNKQFTGHPAVHAVTHVQLDVGCGLAVSRNAGLEACMHSLVVFNPLLYEGT